MPKYRVVIKCERLVPHEQLHPVDQEDEELDGSTAAICVWAPDDTAASEDALDHWHYTHPVKVLEHFNIYVDQIIPL